MRAEQANDEETHQRQTIRIKYIEGKKRATPIMQYITIESAERQRNKTSGGDGERDQNVRY